MAAPEAEAMDVDEAPAPSSRVEVEESREVERAPREAEEEHAEEAEDESRWKERLGEIEAENAAVRLRLHSMVADSESIVRKEFGEDADVPRAVPPPAPSAP